MADFLLELRSEEIPARMQDKAREDLTRLFTAELAKAGLTAREIVTCATPRRLALIARDLPLQTEAVSEETKGPKVGAPPQALEGFLRKVGLTQDQLIERDGVLFAVVEKPGRATKDVLADAVPAIIRAFPWPKSMRWGSASQTTESLRWVRPLQGIVALLGDDVVPCAVDGVASGSATMGHRFHSSGPVAITSAATYADDLRAAYVIVDQEERRAAIRDRARALSSKRGLTWVEDEALVAENAGLTEWPVPLLGDFDPAFLEVPPEVIQLTLATNQKYFVCKGADGKLAPAFICTANIEAKDGGEAIVAGNRKVLAARLSDARFFWEQDKKTPLAEHAKKLAQITFHERLGTVAQRLDRFVHLANDFQGQLPDSIEGAREAAAILKADLVTGMVGEFPELQGVMGGYYARAQNLDQSVAIALSDHYKPVGPSDALPSNDVGVIVSLVDKVDALVGFFGAGLKPTGSKDPFALRRAALGVVRIVTEKGLRLRLKTLFNGAAQLFRNQNIDVQNVGDELLDFFADRLKVQQREAGVRHDLIDAVFALGGEDDLVRLLARVKALQAFMGTDDGANLLAGYKRAANLLKQAGYDPSPLVGEGGEPQVSRVRGDGAINAPSPSAAAAAPPSPTRGEGVESTLLVALDAAEPRAVAAIEAEDFTAAMAALASLRAPIDAFFDGVMVNDPDAAVRAFRLGLLARFRDAVHRVADFSKIEG